MARLDDLMPEFRETKKDLRALNTNVVTGVRRRPWLDKTDDTDINKDTRSISSQTYSDVVSIPSNKEDLSKGSINHVDKPPLSFEDLRSNPLQLFRYLYELSKHEDDNNQTPRVRLKEIMLKLNISKDSARTALRFLLREKFIQRIAFQPGHLGWSRYKLNEVICQQLQRAIQKGFINPFDLDKDIIVENPNKGGNNLNDPWDEVDITPLENIGFNKKHLLQVKNKITPELAQESINHFSYGLKFNKKTIEYSNPIATLISVLKRGEAWIEPLYKSPQELSQIKLLEMKKAESERKKHQT